MVVGTSETAPRWGEVAARPALRAVPSLVLERPQDLGALRAEERIEDGEVYVVRRNGEPTSIVALVTRDERGKQVNGYDVFLTSSAGRAASEPRLLVELAVAFAESVGGRIRLPGPWYLGARPLEPGLYSVEEFLERIAFDELPGPEADD